MSGDYPSEYILLSVVVIGRNEGSRLARCLESVVPLKQMSHGTEILYVDSNSTDNSIDIAKSYGATVIPLRAQSPSAAAARNIGWRTAKGEFVLFLDGDTQLAPDFLHNALPKFVEPQIAIICGHRREINPHDSIYNCVFDLDWIYPTGDVDFCGGDAIVRHKVLVEVGGFNETLIAGEEPEMCRRIRGKGYRVVRLDQLMTRHDLHMMSFGQYWRRCFRTGYAYAEIAHRQGYGRGALWRWESLHNFFKGFLMIGLIILSIFALPWSWKPLGFTCFLFFLLIGRTAVLAKPKAGNWRDSLAYGAHAHFQHIPMFMGQLAYWWDYFMGKCRPIIEYK